MSIVNKAIFTFVGLILFRALSPLYDILNNSLTKVVGHTK